MFKFEEIDSVRSYTGDPTCADAYKWVSELLAETTNAWLTQADEFNDRIKGNIGEFVAFHVVKQGIDIQPGWYVFYSNTDTPLSRISGAGLDIFYLFLGADLAGKLDRLIIQEVKTTGSASLAYARALVDDYEKLKSVDPSLNLQARLRALKARMRDTHNIKDKAILSRVQSLSHPEPAKCSKVHFLPTLVHELTNSLPVLKLSQVRAAISAQGWNIKLISPISIGLTRLDEGFLHLALNKTFAP